jgi:hypothetical protein
MPTLRMFFLRNSNHISAKVVLGLLLFVVFYFLGSETQARNPDMAALATFSPDCFDIPCLCRGSRDISDVFQRFAGGARQLGGFLSAAEGGCQGHDLVL